MSSVAVYTSVCGDDYDWVDRYLDGMYRLGLPFFVHFDRCGPVLKSAMITHPLCAGFTTQDDPNLEFDETHKQKVFDRLVLAGYRWALGMDIDEVPAKDFAEVLPSALDPDAWVIDFRWVNVWGDDRTLRMDGPFGNGHRTNLYQIPRKPGFVWRFDRSITNGAKLYQPGKGYYPPVTPKKDHRLVMVHRGMMTPELCRQHKERWDRIYSTALKGDANPYGFWNYACDPATVPVLQPNPHL